MGLVLDGIESASYKRVQKVRLFRGLPHMGSWYRGCAAVSKTAEKCSSRLLPANGRVPKPGLRGQVATLLFAGSNPAALSIMLRIV